MIKRFAMFALAALIVLMSVAFAGCGNSAPANGAGSAAPAAPSASPAAPPAAAPASGDEYDSYIAAPKSLYVAANISRTASSQTSNKIGTQTTDVTSSGPAQVTRTNGKLELQVNDKIETAGQSVTTTLYYKDGYLYMNMNDTTKMKMAQPEDQMLASQNIGAQTFDKKYVKDMKSAKVGDSTEFIFTVEGQGMDALIQNTEKNLGSGADAALSAANMTFGDATIIVTMDSKGAITKEDVTMSFTMSAGGQDITADVHSVNDNIKIGGANITFPSDLDSYTEMSAAVGSSSSVG